MLEATRRVLKPLRWLIVIALLDSAIAADWPVYRNRAEAPSLWDGVTAALRRAGVAHDVVAIRMRPTAVASCHVDLEQPVGSDALRPIVATYEGKQWRVLCLRSDGQSCPNRGR